MSLRIKIQLPLILLIILISGALGYISYRNASESLYTAMVDNMGGEASALTRAVNDMATSAVSDIVRTAERADILNFYRGDIHDQAYAKTITPVLTHLTQSYDDFSRLSLMDTNGIVVASSDESTIGRDFSDRNYFKSAIADKPFLAPPYKSSVSNDAILAAAAPVKVDGKIVGVAYGVLSLERLYTKNIAPIKVGEHGYGFLLDGNGLIVAHKEKDWVLNDSLSSIPYYKEMVAAKEPGIKEFVGNKGLPVFNYYEKEAFSGITVVIQAEDSDIFSGLTELRDDAILLSVIAIVVGAIVTFLILMPLLRGLKNGMDYADKIAKGDLSGTLKLHSKDELGKLADALRAIPETLKAVVGEYEILEQNIGAGRIDTKGDPTRFSGEYAHLIEGTNSILGRLTDIIDNIPAPTIILDKDFKVLYMNTTAQNVSTTDFKGKSCGEVFRRDDYGSPEDALRKALATGRPASAETVARPQGNPMDISYTSIPMLDAQGKVTFILQLITDLTAIKSTQRTIIDVATQALDISNRVAAASEQLSAQVEEVSQGTERQREHAASTATAMEEMNSTVLEVARNAGEASQEAENTKAKATQGANLVNNVISAIGEVHRVAEDMKVSTEDLGAQAEAIGDIMNVISDIADQTNLLALNAAIEAARAGEAGRGFAVVADEVRKLAEKTMSATVEVGSSIQRIQTSTSDNVKRVTAAAQGVGKATELASESGNALNEIVHFAAHTTELIAGIATAAEEQSATSEEITRAVDEINAIAGETSHGMLESSSAVQELANMAQNLKTLLDKLQA